jgi:4-amino-4-deoxy-L-arabinose transferase-like glycosyltransferase
MSGNNGGTETLASRGRRELPGPCSLALLFCGLSYLSWRKWPDILVDFGRELYVPWQLASGSVLYRDIAYLNGPFSPYFNSLWFRFLGVSLSTIVLVNLALLAVMTALFYALFRRSTDRLTATLSCAVFLCLFGFAHLSMTGNYNFICPYSHDLTHGMLLSALMIFMLARSFERPGRGTISVAGFCLGLSFLTKPEIFLAALPAAIVGLYVLFGACRKRDQRLLPVLGAFLAATLIPVAIAFALLSTGMSTLQALRGVAGGWPHLFQPGLIDSPFYKASMGLDEPWGNLLNMGRAFVWLVFFVAAAGAWSVDSLDWSMDSSTAPVGRSMALLKALRGKRLVSIAACVLLLALALSTRSSPVPWLLIPEAVTLVSLLGGLLLVSVLARHRADHGTFSRIATLLMWATFAFFLLAKMIVNPRFFHYGFALAAPAALLLVVLLLSTLPDLLGRIGLKTRLFRLLVACFILFDLGYFLLMSDKAYGRKTYLVGSGKDHIMTYDPTYDPRGPAVKRLLERVGQSAPREASLVVLPEGVMVNYLARRANPTPYATFMPPELAIYGETRMLEALQNDPPDFIALVSKDMEEYGVGPFGKDPDYGSRMMAWVRARYETIWQIVEGPGQPGQFEAELLRRRAP